MWKSFMAPATAKISYSSVEKWPFLLFLTSFLNKFANWHLLARKTELLRFTMQWTYFRMPLTINKCGIEAFNFLSKLMFVSPFHYFIFKNTNVCANVWQATLNNSLVTMRSVWIPTALNCGTALSLSLSDRQKETWCLWHSRLQKVRSV